MNIKEKIDSIFRPWQKDKPYALPIRQIGGVKFECTSEEDFCWEDWDRITKKKYPILFYLFDHVPHEISCRWSWWVINPMWKFKHRFIPTHKYHIMRTGLKPGYYDPSTQMLYAWMHALEQFIDGTNSVVDWGGTEDHAIAKRHFDKVYAWWKHYPTRLKHIDKAYLKKDCTASYINADGKKVEGHIAMMMESKLDDEANEMLCILAKYRNYMWYP